MLKPLLKNYQIWSPVFFLWFAILLSNVFSWAFNFLASHRLSLENFANLSLYTTFQYLASILGSALLVTVTRFVPDHKYDSKRTIGALGWYGLLAGFVLTLFYFVSATFWVNYFHFPQDSATLWLTGSLFIFLFPLFWARGILNGQQTFWLSGTMALIQTGSKLIIGLSPVSESWTFFLLLSSVPLSHLITLLINLVVIYPTWIKPLFAITRSLWDVPKELIVFYTQSLGLELGTTILTNIDILLVKHYFNGETAGVYALVSLIGKTLFFVNQSIIGILIPLMAARLHKPEQLRILFLGFLTFILVSSVSFIGLVTWLPQYTLNWLIGSKYTLITPYILGYCLAILALSIILIFSSYHLIKKNYLYTMLILVSVVLEVGLIHFFHDNLLQVIYSLLFSTGILAVTVVGLHLPKLYSLLKEKKFGIKETS